MIVYHIDGCQHHAKLSTFANTNIYLAYLNEFLVTVCHYMQSKCSKLLLAVTFLVKLLSFELEIS